MEYPVRLSIDTDRSILVECCDVPEAFAVGYSEEEALVEALNGLESAFMIYMSERRPIPLPSVLNANERLVRLPLRVESKVKLYNEMLSQGVKKAELARRLGWNQVQVDRLLSLHHSTKLESIELAFQAMGKSIGLLVK